MSDASPSHHHRRSSCRGCAGRAPVAVLDLGLQPPANALLAGEADFAGERRFPLELFFCPDCGLVQLLDVVDPELLFGHYLYLTGMSDTMRAHFDAYAGQICADHGLGADDLVVDIASNDGSLLAAFKARGTRVLGVEPAANVAAIANERGIDTVARFFDETVAAELRAERGPAAVATANNVLAHVDDPRAFLAGMRRLVEPEGIVVVEAPELRHLLDRLEYDTIYHEHLSYFSVAALARIFAGAGLGLERVIDQPVHGGTIRLIARPGREHAPEVLARIAAERAAGLLDLDRYRRFAADVAANREALCALLLEARLEGKVVAAYGAPAKGNTLLNYCGIGPELCAFTVDRNPLKAGRFLPGSHVPCLEVDQLLERMPDYVMILPWNLAEEIMDQQAEYRRRGGRFLVPIPQPRVLA
ncbi:MAG: class I SAM-dependent methyltransferase [Planctomycetes bacterium]|nr:class I SAM-dependent methyltransferase [Planctomycetota bacterium]